MTASVPRGHGPLRPEWLNGCAGSSAQRCGGRQSPRRSPLSSSGATGGVPPAELRRPGPRRSEAWNGAAGAPWRPGRFHIGSPAEARTSLFSAIARPRASPGSLAARPGRRARSASALPRLLLDGLDLHVLAPAGVADHLLPLAGLLAQRDFPGHPRLLRDHRPLAGGGDLHRLLLERPIGFPGAQATVLAPTLDLDLLLAQRDRLLDLALAYAAHQALAAGGLFLADAQLLLDGLGALDLPGAAPEQLLRLLHIEAVHHRQGRVGVLDLGGDQHAAPPDRLGVQPGALGREAALDQFLGDSVASLAAEDDDRSFVAAGLDQRAADLLRRFAAFKQSNRKSRHDELSCSTMLSLSGPGRSAPDQRLGSRGEPRRARRSPRGGCASHSRR